MNKETFMNKLKESLFEMERDINLTTVLKELDGWDSLGRLSVVVFLQEGFGVIIDSKTMINFHTVGDIVSLVKEKLED